MRPVNPTLARLRRPAPPRRRARPARLLFALALPALAALAVVPQTRELLQTSWQAARAPLEGEVALPVRTIEVRGVVRTDRARLQRLLAPFYGRNILEVDIGQAERLLHDLPWVADAEIRRLLPDRLQVEITERVPSALWQGPQGLRLLDAAGRPIEGVELTPFAGLPRLAGDGAASAWPELAAALARVPAVAERLVGAVWVNGRRWDLRLRGNIEVRLPEGDPRPALARLAAAQARHRLLERAVRRIDLRHGDWLVVAPVMPVEARAGGVRS